MKKSLSEKFTGYNKIFKKYNITASDINMLDSMIQSGAYTMKCTITKYTKKPENKTFSGASVETETANVSAEFYYNGIAGIAFFHDKVEHSYTAAGRIITRMTCYNPDKTKKLVRSFKLIRNEQ